MLLEKLYADFVSHTNLKDSVYKSVFANISDVLEKVKDVSWEYLKYTDHAGESILFDFTKDNHIAQYGIDLFRNIFMNYYILPENSEVVLGLNYRGVSYKIIDSSKGVAIPEPVAFLNDLGLFHMFLLDREVYDLLGAFDDEFEFIETFKNNVTDIYGPLKKKFETSEAREQVVDGNVSTTKVADTRLSVEVLQNKIKEIIDKIDFIRVERDELTHKRNEMYVGINSKEALLLEKQKLEIELETMQKTHHEYLSKYEKINQLLLDINAELTDITAKTPQSDQEMQELESDKQFLAGKKFVFIRDQKSMKQSLDDFEALISDIQGRIKNINENLVRIDDYDTNTVETTEKRITTLNEEQDNLYGILLGLETELKQQKKEFNESAVKVEQAHIYSDATVKDVEDMSIVNHLATAQQPTSVVTVVNYLRYYFAYNTTVITRELMSQDMNLDTYVMQAVACKLVLAKCFGVHFNQIFSPVDFSDSEIGKVILITKE